MAKYFSNIFVLLCSLWMMAAQAQIEIPIIRIQEVKDGEVKLQDLDVNIEVVGNIATTTYTMVFYNSSSRTLEGEFEFPLGDGQTVSRYALDIDGKMREGVVVEKEKGRKVFEEIERKNVDPGLIEKTKGNNFKTRIYPFNPFGCRKVLVAFEQELKVVDGKRYYRLPLAAGVTLKNFNVDVVLQNQKMPIVEKDALKLNLEKDGEVYKGKFHPANDYTLNKDIVIVLPEDDQPSVSIQNAGATTYFYTLTKVKAKKQPKVLPKNLTILYDVSSSAESANQKAVIELLKAYTNKCGLNKVRLVTFSYKVHTDEVISVDKALNKLETCAYDGATQLGCINLSQYTSDEILIVTDGLSTIGKEELVAGNKPLQVINASSAADHAFLRNMAYNHHGNYIDLTKYDANEALQLLTTNPYSYLGAKYDDSKIKDVYPSLPCPVGESFSVAGTLLPKTANLTLYFGFGNQVTDSLTYEVSSLKNNDANNIKRFWAQKKLAELELDKKRNKEEILDLAKKYSIVTENTSLIVLDRVEDYVRYGIVPPEELREQYNILKMHRSGGERVINGHLSQSILKDREEFLKWWNTKFDPNAVPKAQKQHHIVVSNSDNSSFFDEAVPSAPPAPVAIALRVGDELPADAYVLSTKYGVDPSMKDENSSSISIQYWNPDVPYLSELKSTPVEKMYDAYLKLRKDCKLSPSFYMNVADYFYRENQVEDAVRIISNLCEMKLEDAEMARSCAEKLKAYKSYDLAVSVFQNVQIMRGEEPQSYRDLALAYAENKEYQKAADMLYYASSRKWSNNSGIQQIMINDLNALIAAQKGKIDTSAYDARLMGNCPVDIRVVLQWNTNNCDIDLWVIDPNEEVCNYTHRNTLIGGRLSNDITSGYGPEEFCLKVAKKGTYRIEAYYYGSSSQKKLQPVVVTAVVYTNFGKPNQKKQVLTLQLENIKDVYKIGNIAFK